MIRAMNESNCYSYIQNMLDSDNTDRKPTMIATTPLTISINLTQLQCAMPFKPGTAAARSYSSFPESA